MNATKVFAASVAAISVIGAATFAYAQTTSPAATPPSTGMQAPATPTTQQAPMESSTPAINSGQTTLRDGSSMQTERAARADRN